NCSFCAQSLHNGAKALTYPLQEPEDLLEAAKKAEKNGACRIGIVTSGNRLTDAELESVLEAVELIKTETKLEVCASLGSLNPDRARKLKNAGLSRIHHNLETSEDFFGKICTTHSYAERVRTVEIAKAAGLEVCSGGLIGLGESRKDRIKLAFALRTLDVDAVPLNILTPVPGTSLENAEPLEAMEILKTLALFRLILPDKPIILAGGRERNLRDLQALALLCGANGLITGNYLTTEGQAPARDLRMIRDVGLSVKINL
ncbi:MAG: biotin synthase BioB, partial [Methanosarcinaceae archaeon]|nr:biotin synthase BioB [Methanosarcinaceae archaeon]